MESSNTFGDHPLGKSKWMCSLNFESNLLIAVHDNMLILSEFIAKSFETVIFSEETEMNLFESDGKAKVWKRRVQHLTYRTFVHGGSNAILWGCMFSLYRRYHELTSFSGHFKRKCKGKCPKIRKRYIL